MSIKKENFFAFLLLLIFASGLAIYVWNRLHGKDLSVPPNFDLSAYNSVNLGQGFDSEIKKQIEVEIQRVLEARKNNARVEEKVVGASEEKKENASPFESGYIYFKDSFRLGDVDKTNALLQSFVSDFPELKLVTIDNFDLFPSIKIEVPALGREQVVEKIKTQEGVSDLIVLEAPLWQINFKTNKSELEIAEFLKDFPEIKMVPLEKRTIEGYVARAAISYLKLEPTFIEKMQKEYSDVLTIMP